MRSSTPTVTDAGHTVDLALRLRLALMVATALGIVLGIASIGYPMTVDGRVGAGLFPVTVAVLLIVCALGSMALDAGTRSLDSDDTADEDGERLFGESAWRVPALVGILIAYVVIVEELGHLITSCLLTWACLLLIGGRAWWQQILFGLALGIGTAELFARLGVHLPLGVLLT